jgi:hypothetical protein
MFKSSEYTFNTYERTFKAFERRFLFIIKTSILSKKYSFYMKKTITTLMLCLTVLSMTAKGHTAANNRLVIAKAPAGREQRCERTGQQVHPTQVTRHRLYPSTGMDNQGRTQ